MFNVQKCTHLKPGAEEGSAQKPPRYVTLFSPHEICAKLFCLKRHGHSTLNTLAGWRTTVFVYLMFPYRYVARLNTTNECIVGTSYLCFRMLYLRSCITNFDKIWYVLYIQNWRKKLIFVCIGYIGHNLYFALLSARIYRLSKTDLSYKTSVLYTKYRPN